MIVKGRLYLLHGSILLYKNIFLFPSLQSVVITKKYSFHALLFLGETFSTRAIGSMSIKIISFSAFVSNSVKYEAWFTT